MAKVESVAPTIDFEALLKPISDEKPTGEPMQYSGLYDEIREARRADDTSLSQGKWQTDLKVADYRKVIDVATSALATQTKDIQVGVWFTEALTAQHGFAGFRDGVRLLRQYEENFWEILYPEIDEGDMEARANAFDWMNRELAFRLKKVPLTLGDGLSFIGWEEAARFDFPESTEGLPYDESEKFRKLKEQAEAENRKTGTQLRKSKAATNRAFIESINLTINECFTEVNELDRVNEEKFDRNQVPSLNDLKKSLSDILSVVTPILEEKRLEEPDPDDFADEATEETGEDGEVVRKGPAVPTGAIQNRADALKRLTDIADYFRKTEPNSPVSALIQRAVKWGNMSFDMLLQDMITDTNVISQIRQTLGVNADGSTDGQ
jgi:type VI secretion system protein ImpA